jgi:hypothetical protein
MRVIRVVTTVLVRRLMKRRLGWPIRMFICGFADADAAVDLASTDGTANTIVPNIAENIKNFFIFPSPCSL